MHKKEEQNQTTGDTAALRLGSQPGPGPASQPTTVSSLWACVSVVPQCANGTTILGSQGNVPAINNAQLGIPMKQ